MTQIEYDAKMKQLDEECFMQLEPLHDELHELEQKKQQLNASILETRLKISEIGREMYDVCARMRDIKVHYKKMKHEVYKDRPAHEAV